jgi:hypothetical protein
VRVAPAELGPRAMDPATGSTPRPPAMQPAAETGEF